MKILLPRKTALAIGCFPINRRPLVLPKRSAVLEIIREPDDRAGISLGHPRPFFLQNFCISAPARERNSWDRLICSVAPSKRPVAGLASYVSKTPTLPSTLGRRQNLSSCAPNLAVNEECLSARQFSSTPIRAGHGGAHKEGVPLSVSCGPEKPSMFFFKSDRSRNPCLLTSSARRLCSLERRPASPVVRLLCPSDADHDSTGMPSHLLRFFRRNPLRA